MSRSSRARRCMLYGATGFSGGLVAELARRRGLALLLAGRDGTRLSRFAEQLGFEHRVLPLDDPARLTAALREVDVVLNAAGPFAATARPLLDACLRTSTHYLDIAGELPELAAIARRDGAARASGVMLMPAVGFVVVPSDCLAAHIARRLPGAQHLTIAVSRTDAVSRGSLATVLEHWSDTVALCRDGVLVAIPSGQRERRFDYGRGPSRSTAVSWGDLLTAPRTTGIPNVEVFLEVSPAERALFRLSSRLGPVLESTPLRRFLRVPIDLLGAAPTDQRRASSGRVLVAEARAAAGRCVRARLRTPDAYAFTAAAALAVVERVLNGELCAGFQTPARVYGADFVLTVEGVAREDL